MTQAFVTPLRHEEMSILKVLSVERFAHVEVDIAYTWVCTISYAYLQVEPTCTVVTTGPCIRYKNQTNLVFYSPPSHQMSEEE
jgi:hypothetical protein